MQLHNFELDLIRYIHQFRTPLLDQFFKSLDFFDRQEFFFILLPIVWLGYNWKAGLRLFYILFLSSMANYALKQFFDSPRPFHIDPGLGIIQVSGLGFPSGAGQTVILLSGIILNVWKSYWKWAVVSLYILLVSFSRVYLGVHFPSDILGGWIVGLSLWGIYTHLFPIVESYLERFKPIVLLLLSEIVPAMILISQYSIFAMRTCGIAMGIGLGLYIAHSYRLFLPSPKNLKESIFRIIIGIAGTFSCYALMTLLIPNPGPIIYLFPRFFLLGLWISLGSQILLLYIKRKTLALQTLREFNR